ncbi:MAG: hypothetical protein HY710_06860 [Candidatus Latescibacteria bacterium]|nr:hypothetical protein [Candidatus Latescibacterota bacterium]
MRHILICSFMSLFMLVSIAAVAAHAQEKMGKSTTVEGELIDLRCFSAQGSRGEKHQMCAVACAKVGDPVGIVDAKGKVYTLGSQTGGYVDHMAKTARVTGMVSGNVIIPMKVEVKEGNSWKTITLPKEMM